MSVKVGPKWLLNVEGVHQRLHGYMIWYVYFRDNGFELLHKISQALSVRVVEIPKIRGGGFLSSEHDVAFEESRRDVVKTINRVLLKTGEPVESDTF